MKTTFGDRMRWYRASKSHEVWTNRGFDEVAGRIRGRPLPIGPFVQIGDFSRSSNFIYTRCGWYFDLVFSDVVLPGEDGLSLTEGLLQARSGFKAILTSGYTDAQVTAAIYGKGYTFLQKPYALPVLTRVINQALRGRRQGEPKP